MKMLLAAAATTMSAVLLVPTLSVGPLKTEAPAAVAAAAPAAQATRSLA